MIKLPTLKFASPDAVRALRLKTGLNQSAFWGRVGVTQSGGSRFETARSLPRPVLILLTITYGKPSQVQAMTEALRAWKQ